MHRVLTGVICACPILCCSPALGGGFSAEANKDYVLYWLPYGVSGRSPEGTRQFAFQTPHYIACFDLTKMTFTKFAGLSGLSRESQPDRRSDSFLASAPAASMQMTIATRDGDYMLSNWSNDKARLLMFDGGKFCYQIKIDNIAFRRSDGETLPAEVIAEFHAWADKLFVTIHVTPTEDLEVRSSELSLAFGGQFDNYLGVAGSKESVSALKPEAGIDGCADLNSFYRASGKGVSVISSVPSDFESHRVKRTASGVEHCAVVYDQANHRGRTSTWKSGEERQISFQLMGTVKDHKKACLEDLANERDSARLTVLSSSSGKTDSYKGYQPRSGYYHIDNPATHSDKSLHREAVNFAERVKFRLENTSRAPRRVRLMVSQGILQGIEGPSSVLVDKDDWPTGLDVQISKNWHGHLWYHSYTVLNLAPGQEQEQSMLVAFQNWGTKPAVCHGQLSLYGYDTTIENWQNAPINCQAWYEMSQGLTESICYDPTAFHCQNVVCDVRPMFFNEPTGSWWASNVGGADFLAYYDKSDKKLMVSQPKVYHDKQCNCLADIEHVWMSEDGKARQSVRARSFANTDMLRSIYNIRLDVLEDIEFNNLSVFTWGAPNYNACQPRSLAWGTLDGLSEVRELDYSSEGYQSPGIVASKPGTWVALYNDVAGIGGPEVNGGANRGLVIRSCRGRVHGEPVSAVALDVRRLKGHLHPIQMLLEVNPPGADGSLKAGDYLEAEIEILAYHKAAEPYIGPNPTMKHLLEQYGDSWQIAYWDAVHNNIRITANKGTVLGTYPVIIELDKNREAEFTLTGGMGYVPIEIRGFVDYTDIALQQQVDGKWVTIDQSVHGKDFWQTQYDPATRTYAGIFNVPMDPTDTKLLENRFRVVSAASR